MEICHICEEHEQSPNTKCVSGHMVCNGCYNRLTQCPYCRCGYILTFGCMHNHIHNDEVLRMSQEDHDKYLEYTSEKGSEIQKIFQNKEKLDIMKEHNYENNYTRISQWVCMGGHQGISPLYAMCLEDAITELDPCLIDAKDAYNEYYIYGDKYLMYEHLPKGVKIYLSYIPMDEKYIWLTKLNERYAHIEMCLMEGSHIKHCMTENEYYILCNCVADEYLVWIISKYTNHLLKQKMLEFPNLLSKMDIEKRNLFQNNGFLQDEDFLFMDNDNLFQRDKELCIKTWTMLRTINICPCDWYMKFR